MVVGYIIEQPDIKADSIVLFFAGLGICYTASAANFKENKVTETWHMVGAYGGFAFGYAFIVVRYGLDSIWFIIPSLLAAFIIYKNEKKKVSKSFEYMLENDLIVSDKEYESKIIWWAEIIGLITIYLAIL